MINNDSNTTADKLQDATATLLTTKEAAELLDVSPRAVANWRSRKLFGCHFFTADEKHGNTWYYERERVEQLKSVYQKGVLDNMYKLALLNAEAEEDVSELFQKTDSSGEMPVVTRHRGLLTAEYVAAKFNVTVRTVEMWVKSGELHWTEFDHKHRLLFSDNDIEAFERRREKNTEGKTMGFAIKGFDETQAAGDDEFAYNYREEDEPATVETAKKEPPTTADNRIQRLENLPAELLEQPRFFAVNAKKVPLIDAWSKPENQRPAAQIDGLKGFDTCGHGQAADYLMIDCDHVLNDNGEFVNDDAVKWYNFITQSFDDVYCERSISRHGLHIFAKPTPEKFSTITAGQRGTLYFGKHDSGEEKKSCPKMELFYQSKGRYCLVTGKLFRDSGRNIPAGAIVDDVFQTLLDEVQKQIAAGTGAKKPARGASDKSAVVDTADYDEYRAPIMLDCIEPADLADTDWLAVISSCKNLGISYSVVDAWNSRDSARYNEAENLKRWDSLNDSSYNIETLHGIAKRFGYDEKKTRREWYQAHPELKTVTHALKDLREYANRRQFSLHPALRGRNNLKLTDEQRKFLFAGDLSDLDFARRIEFAFGKNIRWLTDRAKWATYGKKGVWNISNEGDSAILPAATKLADMLRFNVRPAKLPADGRLTDDDIKEQNRAGWELKVAQQFKRSNKTGGAIKKLCSLDSIRITADDLDNHPELLNCLNGVVDLQTGKLIPAAPELLLSQQVAADYQPNYRNEVVDKFFETVLPDDDTRAALFRWLGYSITGDVSEEKALFIIGTGGNGKGTLTRFLITLLNSYAASIPVTAVCEAGRFKDAGAATPELNALEKCRLAIVEELPQGVRLDVAKFKLLTGGDKIPVRRLHEEFRNILPTHKLCLSGNHLPTLNDTRDPGLLRRLMNMKFEADFTKNPDRKLKQKLATPEALSALLSLVVSAAQEWYRDGLIESSAMKQARADYLSDNDFIAEFISAHCTRDPNASTTRKAFLTRIRTEYSSECAQMSDRALIDAVQKISGISYRRAKGGFKFFGVGLCETLAANDDEQPNDDFHTQEELDEVIDEFFFPPDSLH